jgi:large subunit ribosomal protein L14
MLQMQSVMTVADNSGAKRIRVIKVLGGTHRRYAYVGDVVVVSVIDAIPHGKVKKGEIHKALIVRGKCCLKRSDNSYVKFDDNAAVLLDKKSLEPIGTRVFGPVARESGNKRVMSLAAEVV